MSHSTQLVPPTNKHLAARMVLAKGKALNLDSRRVDKRSASTNAVAVDAPTAYPPYSELILPSLIGAPMQPSSLDVHADLAASGLVPGQSPEPVRLARPGRLFERRAERLQQLAQGHSLGPWLEFIATLSRAQHKVITTPPLELSLPEQQWQADFEALLTELRHSAPDSVQEVLKTISLYDASQRNAMAERVLSGQLARGDAAAAPFVAAALQVAWTRYAAALDPTSLGQPSTSPVCPVCGSTPVCGVIEIGAEASGLRYLHCGLCHSAWHHIRTRCVACGDEEHISYQHIDGQSGAQAESCDHCHSYLKLLRAKDLPHLDPIADDLASLSLDLLLADTDLQRIGVNVFMMLEE